MIITLASIFSVYKASALNDNEFNPSIYQAGIFIASIIVYNNYKLIKLFNSVKNLYFKKILILSSIILSFYYAYLFLNTYGWNSLLFISTLFVLSIFYNFTYYKHKISIGNFRAVAYLKIFLISFVWASVSSLIILKFNILTVLSFIQNFIFIFAITLPFDLRDKEIDRKHGVKTLAHCYNSSQLLTIANLLITFNLISSIILFPIFEIEVYLIPELLIYFYVVILLKLFPKMKNEILIYELLDISIIIYGILYILIF